MATQIVMDRTGDTRHNFDANNADALLEPIQEVGIQEQ